jgi:hypothetical protein
LEVRAARGFGGADRRDRGMACFFLNFPRRGKFSVSYATPYGMAGLGELFIDARKEWTADVIGIVTDRFQRRLTGLAAVLIRFLRPGV